MFIPRVPLQAVLRLGNAVAYKGVANVDARLAGLVGLGWADLRRATDTLAEIGAVQSMQGMIRARGDALERILHAVSKGNLEEVSTWLKGVGSYKAFLSLLGRGPVRLSEGPGGAHVPFDTDAVIPGFDVLLEYACLVGDAWVHGGCARPGHARPSKPYLRKAFERAFEAVAADGRAWTSDLVPRLCIGTGMSPWAMQRGVSALFVTGGLDGYGFGGGQETRPSTLMRVLGKAPWMDAGCEVHLDRIVVAGVATSVVEVRLPASGPVRATGPVPDYLRDAGPSALSAGSIPPGVASCVSLGGIPRRPAKGSGIPSATGRDAPASGAAMPCPRETVALRFPENEQLPAPGLFHKDGSSRLPWGWRAEARGDVVAGIVDERGRRRVDVDAGGNPTLLPRYALVAMGPRGGMGIPMSRDEACVVLLDAGKPIASSPPHDAYADGEHLGPLARMSAWVDSALPGWRDPVASWRLDLGGPMPPGMGAYPVEAVAGMVELPPEVDAVALSALGFRCVPGGGNARGFVPHSMPVGWSCGPDAWTLVDARGRERSRPGHGTLEFVPRHRVLMLRGGGSLSRQANVGHGQACAAHVDGGRVVSASKCFAWPNRSIAEHCAAQVNAVVSKSHPDHENPHAYWSDPD